MQSLGPVQEDKENFTVVHSRGFVGKADRRISDALAEKTCFPVDQSSRGKDLSTVPKGKRKRNRCEHCHCLRSQ